MKTQEVAKNCKAIRTEVAKAIVEKDAVIGQLMLAFLAGGHVLFEDYPGLAKTLMANTFSRAIGCGFKRVQFTPDLLPADITGTFILNRGTSQFELRKGPIFTNILLADEINRAPPKTQSALLESMEEGQVTIEGNTFRLPRHFMVIATINPIEAEGVYPLPEAQLDGFMFKTKMGYLPGDLELKMLKRKIRQEAEPAVPQGKGLKMIDAMKDLFPRVKVDDRMVRYVRDIIVATRSHPDIVLGASPRAGEQMLYAAQGNALIDGRNFVLPDDVKHVAPKVLNHRLILSVESDMDGRDADSVISGVLSSVKVPKS